jgi:chromatin modification-related protein EAF6
MDSGGGGGSGGNKAASGSAPSPAPNPTAMLSALMSKRATLQEELRSIERQVRASPSPCFSQASFSFRVCVGWSDYFSEHAVFQGNWGLVLLKM